MIVGHVQVTRNNWLDVGDLFSRTSDLSEPLRFLSWQDNWSFAAERCSDKSIVLYRRKAIVWVFCRSLKRVNPRVLYSETLA